MRWVRLWPWRRALVEGDSMLPSYSPRSVVLWRVGGRPLREGDVVVVQLPDGRPLGIKRLGSRADGGWHLVSDNPAAGTDSRTFGPVEDAAVLGRVVGRLHEGASTATRG